MLVIMTLQFNNDSSVSESRMDPQFSLASADNKGILSLLSAIEQSGDQFETDPDSPPDIKDDDNSVSAAPVFNHQLEDSLDLSLSLNKSVGLCLICGGTSLMETTSEGVNMVDISMQISGIKIADKIEDIVSRKILPEKHSTLICSECYGLLQQIEMLETELLKCKRTITSKFSVSNPVKPNKSSPKKSNNTTTHNFRNIPTTLDYTVPLLDTKMPMNFMASEKEIERDILHMKGKSKLDILTDTVREFDDYEEEDSDPVSSALECDKCGRKFKSSSLFQKHMKSHAAKDKVHKCHECGKELTTKSNLQAHLKTHFETKVFTCPHCEKELKGKKSLLDHVASLHNKEKRFACMFCAECFTSRHLKNVHERLHNGEQGFICEQCGDSFSTAQGLSNHKSKHTGDFQYSCKHCDKGFNNQKLLEEHQHIHTGSKPYTCKTCGTGFANRGSLWIHMKKHETLKPYPCPDCKKAFSHSSHLAVHRRLHTGERPYKCRICAEGFVSSNNLKRHMKSHSNQLPFACGSCKQAFSQRRQLVAHSNQMHAGNVVEDIPKHDQMMETPGVTADDGYGQLCQLPVSIVEDGQLLSDAGMETAGAAEQQRIVDLLDQDGVSLGQTIVLIQVPSEHGEATEVKTIEVDHQ